MSDAGSLPSASPTLLLGSTGQLGLTLCQSLSKVGLSLPRRVEADLLNLRQLSDWVVWL